MQALLYIERAIMKRIVLILTIGVFLLFGLTNVCGLEPDSRELKNGLFYEDKTSLAEENFNYEITKICRHNDGFIVVGKAEDTEEITVNLEFYNTYPYIAYYDHDGFKWSFVDKTIGHGEYRDAIVMDNEVVAIGTYENGDRIARLLVTRFNSSGKVKARVDFDANGMTFGYHILYENKKIYLLGLTNATHFLDDTVNVNNKIFVLKMSNNYDKEKIKFIYNSEMSELYDACISNGFIYVHCQLNGTGIYDVSDSVPVNSLVSVDTSLNHIYHQKVVRYKYMKIGCNADGLYLFKTNGLLKNLTLEEYDVGLSTIRTTYPCKDIDGEVESLRVGSSSLHEPVSCYIGFTNNDKNYVEYIDIDLDSSVIMNLTREVTNKVTAGGVFILDDYLYLFSNLDSQREINKLVYLKEEDGRIYANGILCRCESEEITSNAYGTYKQKTTHYFSDIEIYTYSDCVIPLRISIKDRGVYDRRVILEFNGVGYLNNERIDSGYIIADEGRYILEVRGKDEVKYFNFEVKDITIDEVCFDVEVPVISSPKITGTISAGTINYEDRTSSLNFDNFENGVVNNNYVVIAVVVVGITGGMFIPFERITRKNKEITNE